MKGLGYVIAAYVGAALLYATYAIRLLQHAHHLGGKSRARAR